LPGKLHFKHCAGMDSDSAKHRFSAPEENVAGQGFPAACRDRHILPVPGKFCRAKRQIPPGWPPAPPLFPRKQEAPPKAFIMNAAAGLAAAAAARSR
jgi:hypothetical protein